MYSWSFGTKGTMCEDLTSVGFFKVRSPAYLPSIAIEKKEKLQAQSLASWMKY
jgi:hypothetical protein